jgi:hypothetical protein
MTDFDLLLAMYLIPMLLCWTFFPLMHIHEKLAYPTITKPLTKIKLLSAFFYSICPTLNIVFAGWAIIMASCIPYELCKRKYSSWWDQPVFEKKKEEEIPEIEIPNIVKFRIDTDDDGKFHVFDLALKLTMETAHDTKEEAEEHAKSLF